MIIKNFISLLGGTSVNGDKQKTVIFVTPTKTYATNEAGGILLLQEFETHDIFDDVVTNFCFAFFNIGDALKKFAGLHDAELSVDFKYTSTEYNGFKVVRESKFSRLSPKLGFTIGHQAPEYVLGGTVANPFNKNFSIFGDVINIEDGRTFLENINRIDKQDVSGNPNHITFSNKNGGNVVIATHGEDYFEVAEVELKRPFKVYQKDLTTIKAKELTITVGESGILISHDNSKYYIPTSKVDSYLEKDGQKAVESFLDLTNIDHEG